VSRAAPLGATALLLLSFASCASVQEAVLTPAATQPSPGHVLVREQLRAYSADRDPRTGERDLRELVLSTSVRVGLRHDIALGLEVPASAKWYELSSGASDRDANVGDVRLRGAWRFHKRDVGPIDTERAAALLGVQLDTGSGASLRPGFSEGAFNPLAGLAYTRIAGRHGFGLAAEGMLHTEGGADRLSYDASYLYRAFPAAYETDTSAAAYLVLECNGISETNGDHELLLSPGLMYEASRWAFEAAVQVPLWQDLDKRPEVDLGLVLGVRYLF
jgi:hypothetical protein